MVRFCRDFLYIEDAVEAIMMCALEQKAVGEVLNVGVDQPTNFIELGGRLDSAAGSGRWEFAPFSAERKAQEPGDFYSDIGKIRRIVGWEPRTSWKMACEQLSSIIGNINSSTGGMMPQVNIHPTVKLGANVSIMGDLSLGPNVEVGANVTFFPKVFVGAGTKILPGTVIGRPPMRAGTTNRPIDLGDETVRIGAECSIGANCVLYTNLNIATTCCWGDLHRFARAVGWRMIPWSDAPA